MQSEIPPSLTRHDVVMAVLRIQLWIMGVSLGRSVFWLLFVFFVLHAQFDSIQWIYGPVSNVVPVVLLLVFSQLLAANVLGDTRHTLVSSWPEMRPLIGQCAGLWLFVYSLGGVVFTLGTIAYEVVMRSGSSILRSSATTVWLKLMPLIQECPVLLLGFFLAFGPAIRDNFRVR